MVAIENSLLAVWVYWDVEAGKSADFQLGGKVK